MEISFPDGLVSVHALAAVIFQCHEVHGKQIHPRVHRLGCRRSQSFFICQGSRCRSLRTRMGVGMDPVVVFGVRWL